MSSSTKSVSYKDNGLLVAHQEVIEEMKRVAPFCTTEELAECLGRAQTIHFDDQPMTISAESTAEELLEIIKRYATIYGPHITELIPIARGGGSQVWWIERNECKDIFLRIALKVDSFSDFLRETDVICVLCDVLLTQTRV